MKTNNKKQDIKNQAGGECLIPAPICVASPDIAPPKRNKIMVMKLRSNRKVNNSQTHKLFIKLFRTGSLEE
jgi:hypothetical protein